MIVVGGGLSRIARLYDDVPRRCGARGCFPIASTTRLVPAQFGDASGVRGAAWLWDRYATLDLRECLPLSIRRVAMPDEGIETLFGSFDENLRSLESALGVTLKTSGHDVVIEGDAEDVGARRARRWRSWARCCARATGSRAAT